MTISRTVDGDVAVLTVDDGKANAFDLDFFERLDERLDACAEDGAVVIAGRDGMFSAGLNLKVLAAATPEQLHELLVRFGHTMLRVWLEPRPVVAAATGHALAGGTILSMVCDHTVAARGEFRWGLTETTIGFPIPEWILAVARGNLPAGRLDDLVLPGRMVDPQTAVEVGYADELAAPGDVVTAATEHARALAELPRGVYAETKRRLRQAPALTALDGIEDDIAGMLKRSELG